MDKRPILGDEGFCTRFYILSDTNVTTGDGRKLVL